MYLHAISSNASWCRRGGRGSSVMGGWEWGFGWLGMGLWWAGNGVMVDWEWAGNEVSHTILHKPASLLVEVVLPPPFWLCTAGEWEAFACDCSFLVGDKGRESFGSALISTRGNVRGLRALTTTCFIFLWPLLDGFEELAEDLGFDC